MEDFKVEILKHPTDEDCQTREVTIKQTLLSFPEIIDNNFLTNYCTLVVKNDKKQHVKFETQCHHIVPRAFSKSKNAPVDNSKNNLAILSYSDHVLAHYYLVKCMRESQLRYKMLCALTYLYSNASKKIEDIELKSLQLDIQKIYTDKKQAASKYRTGVKTKGMSEEGKKNIGLAHRGMVPWNKGKPMSEEQKQKLKNVWSNRPKSEKWKKSRRNKGVKPSQETKEKISNTLKGHFVSAETRGKIGKINKGKKWMNNGEEEVYITEEFFEYYQKEGYHFGRKQTIRSPRIK